MCTVLAVQASTVHIVDYGRLEVPRELKHERLDRDRGLVAAMHEMEELANAGWAHSDGDRLIDLVLIDSGWATDAVYWFVQHQSSPGLCWPSKGYGAGQDRRGYKQPRRRGKRVLWIGEQCHLAKIDHPSAMRLVEFNADHWKSFVHARLAAPIDADGAMTLFRAAPSDHRSLAAHLTAERQVLEFVPGKGEVLRWERVNRNNHWLDALVMASVAAHLRGWRLLDGPAELAPSKPVKQTGRPLFTVQGRPFYTQERD